MKYPYSDDEVRTFEVNEPMQIFPLIKRGVTGRNVKPFRDKAAGDEVPKEETVLEPVALPSETDSPPEVEKEEGQSHAPASPKPPSRPTPSTPPSSPVRSPGKP